MAISITGNFQLKLKASKAAKSAPYKVVITLMGFLWLALLVK